MTARLVLLALLTLSATLAVTPAADATDCVSPPPVCPPGAVPWPRAGSGSCGGRGVTWSCAWLA